MNCVICGDRERKCLSCYDMSGGITNLRRSIDYLESELKKRKLKLQKLLELEKPNRIQSLNEYLSK